MSKFIKIQKAYVNFDLVIEFVSLNFKERNYFGGYYCEYILKFFYARRQDEYRVFCFDSEEERDAVLARIEKILNIEE